MNQVERIYHYTCSVTHTCIFEADTSILMILPQTTLAFPYRSLLVLLVICRLTYTPTQYICTELNIGPTAANGNGDRIGMKANKSV